MNNHHQAFLALVRAGLWEQDVRLAPYGEVDFAEVYRLACQQKVVGLVAAGLDLVVDRRVPEEAVVPFGGDVLHLEQRNQAMNQYVARLFRVFHKNGVNALLVKGQGIAQCYSRPLWRASGDIDLLFDKANYLDAKKNMLPRASSITEEEDPRRLHLGLLMDSWVVELHGTLNHRFMSRVNRELAELQRVVLEEGRVRLWHNDGVDIPLPAPDEDVVFVFSHILEHFFSLGIGLRQICDWCRLLYTYNTPSASADAAAAVPPTTAAAVPPFEGGRGVETRPPSPTITPSPNPSLQGGDEKKTSQAKGSAAAAIPPTTAAAVPPFDLVLLEKRLRRMGILSEWKAFAAFAVDTLGMPPERMPLYSPDRKWARKGKKIQSYVMKYGNLGHNRDRSYFFAPYLKKKTIAFCRMIQGNADRMAIFPKDTLMIWYVKFFDSVKRLLRGK